MKLVRIAKDGIDGTGEVPESAIPRVTEQGWRVVDDNDVTGEVSELKGQDLDEALDAAGLSKKGSADEKRARLAEYHAQQ